VSTPLGTKVALWTSWSVIAIGALTAIPVARDYHSWHDAHDRRVASSVVHRYANESFVRWGMDHPVQDRPLFVGELAAYVDGLGSSGRDPWGDEYVVRAAPVGIVVMSAGHDRILYTADDIRSDDGLDEPMP
jgi:hypothetical protein